jgi:allantoicase
MHFTELIDPAAERLGGAVLAARDEFFAPKENLLKAERPVWREGEFTHRGGQIGNHCCFWLRNRF